jgi:hypothetical protein
MPRFFSVIKQLNLRNTQAHGSPAVRADCLPLGVRQRIELLPQCGKCLEFLAFHLREELPPAGWIAQVTSRY